MQLQLKKAGKSGWGVVKNAILGAAMGIAAGGAIITLGAVGAGAAAALSASTSTAATFLSVPAAQAFAIGALGVNFAAYVITPIYGIKMEGMDKFEVNPVQVDPPRETPLHPAEKRSKRWK